MMKKKNKQSKLMRERASWISSQSSILFKIPKLGYFFQGGGGKSTINKLDPLLTQISDFVLLLIMGNNNVKQLISLINKYVKQLLSVKRNF